MLRNRITFLVLACALAGFPDYAAIAQTSLKILVIAGEDAINIIQQKTATAPIVEVRDRNDLPVAGATVVFSVNGSSATIGGAQTLTVVTNAAGQAAATGLTPTAAGALNISATATFQEQTVTVTIAQSNVMTAAEAAKLARAGGASSGGGVSAGKVIAIVGGIGAAGAGAAVATGGSSDSPATTTSSATPTGTTPTTSTGTTPAPSPTTPTPPNAAPVINAATATPAAGLVAVTPIAFDVQASDPDNDQLTYFWEFPDGTTSEQRAFSRVFNVGGTHNSRITVRDGKTSTSREFSFEMKTLTGQWDATGLRVYSLVQNGSTITGSFPWRGTICPMTGSLRSSAPHVIFDVPACGGPVVFNGQQIAYTTDEFHIELELDAAMSVLRGTERVRTRNETIHGVIQNFERTGPIELRKR